MMLKTNLKDKGVACHFGHKPLFDGYLTNSEFLCDGYVIGSANHRLKSLIINTFLCDSYVIGSPMLFVGYLTREKK